MNLRARITKWMQDHDWRQHHFEDDCHWFHRRGFFRFGDLVLRYELCFPAKSCSLTTRVDDEELHFHVALPPVSAFMGVEHPLQRKAFYALVREEDHYKGGMDIGLRVFDQALWWDVWHTAHEWTAGTPRWRHGSFHPLDAWFGRLTINTKERSVHDVLIPMSEKNYRAHVTLTDDKWTRARWPWWPFTRTRQRCDVQIPGGIPMPGKGENSYDCGDDGLYGITADARTPEEAVAAVVQSVIATRRRRGGGTGTEPWKTEPERRQDAVQQ